LIKISPFKRLSLLNTTAIGAVLLAAGACATPGPDSNSSSAPADNTPPPAQNHSTSPRVSISPLDSPVANTPISTPKPPTPIENESHEYNALHQLYVTQKCDDAIPRLEQFEKYHPASNYLSEIENLHGLCSLTMKDPRSAISHFRNAMATNRTNPSYAPYLAYNLAKAQFEAGQAQDASDTIAKIKAGGQDQQMDADNRSKLELLQVAVANALRLSASPTPSATPSASSTPAPALSEAPLEPKKIGVLLPLKGKYGKFSRKTLDAIELALGIFGPESDSGLSVVVEDSGEEPDTEIQALTRLVIDHHVAAVIGPLLSKGIDQVSKRANELGVPMLSLARYANMSADNSSDNDYTLQAGVTSQLQAKEIARYAIQSLGLRKFAILYPKGKAGDESAQAFWDAVDQMGGQITGIESYASDDTDFRQVVDKLSGLYYTEARQRELDQLAKLRAENKIKKRTRKTEQYFSLPPIADYQAIFIPDEAKTAGLIIPTFAYRDVDHVTFLGTSSWDSPELASSAQNYAEGALFVDSFFAHSPAKNVQKFMLSYRSEYGQDPTAMEAIAYDAALTLDQAIHEAGRNYSRKDLLHELHDIKDLAGVTGKLTYKNGQIDRELKVLALRNGQIVEDSK
jgi:ABC-type branched-subunit amino acid transport system substrate-binding protein/TolA-binding protein